VPHIVSASRRTDIPQFFGAWFEARRKAGYCESRNVFGGSYRISLRPEDVTGYLFWTKNSAPFAAQVGALLEEGVPVAFQFTITGYGPPIEANIPGLDVTIPAFRRLSGTIPSPAAIQWRYDPILVSESFGADRHRDNFRRIAAALEGKTRVCNVSFVEPYEKVIRRMRVDGIRYRSFIAERHRQAARKNPGLRRMGEPEAALVWELSEIAREHGIELRSCCDPGLRLPPSSCCGIELFECYGIRDTLRLLPPGPTRKGCRCLKSLDIGMDNTCPGGCAYCYVTNAPESAVGNYRNHSPESVRMR
jgi:hypothetical protein